MTPEQVKIVQNSWHKTEPNQLTDSFYKRLFEINPQLEELFLNSISVQREKFAATLSLIVTHIDDPAQLLPKVHALGVQHAGYGVLDEHYDQVESALLFALRIQLGKNLDEASEQAWKLAYQSVAEIMKMADINSARQPL